MIHCQGGCAPVNLYFSFQHIRTVTVDRVAKPFIGFGEKGGFHNTGFILEGQKFHGVAVFGGNHLAGDQPAGQAYSFSEVTRQIDRFDSPQFLQKGAI